MIELLVVIGVIGIIAAIALPMISNTFDASVNQAGRRNAQNIVTLYNAAKSCGAPLPAASNLDEVISVLKEGVTGTGSMAGVTFQMGSLTDSQRLAAENYITQAPGGLLAYDSRAD